MKLHRIFIAINLPEEIKKKLLEYKNKWQELPARWTSKENLHLTLAFLGNTSDQELAEVCSSMERIGEKYDPFSLVFTKIVYGPFDYAQGKPNAKIPRMIWAVGEDSPELSALQHDIASTLASSEDPSTSLRASQPFSPHLTLARLRTFELQKMDLEELPGINEEISLPFHVASIEIMESKLKRSGAEYTVLQAIPLKSE